MDNDQLKSLLSENAGETAALRAVLFAICESIAPDSPLASRITHRLEQSYAELLQGATNSEYFSGFEKTMDLLKEALTIQPGD